MPTSNIHRFVKGSVAAGIMLGSACAFAQDAPTLPDFTFREHSSNALYDLSQLTKKAGCRDVQGMRRCVSETVVSGWRMDMMFSIVNQRLYTFELFAHRNAIPEMLDALKARYGLPCRSAKETVKNRVGGSFESHTFTWCFRTGEMVFRERDYELDRFSVIYTDRVNAPTPRAVVPDF